MRSVPTISAKLPWCSMVTMDVKGRFPPGARLHKTEWSQGISWRVLILDHIEQSSMLDQIQPMSNGGAFDWAAEKIAIPTVPLSQHAEAAGRRGAPNIQLLRYCGSLPKQ